MGTCKIALREDEDDRRIWMHRGYSLASMCASALTAAKKEEAAVAGGFLLTAKRSSELLQAVRNSRELRRQVRADGLNDGDDRHRDACGNETVLDRSRTRLVLEKRNNLGHVLAPGGSMRATWRRGVKNALRNWSRFCCRT